MNSRHSFSHFPMRKVLQIRKYYRPLSKLAEASSGKALLFMSAVEFRKKSNAFSLLEVLITMSLLLVFLLLLMTTAKTVLNSWSYFYQEQEENRQACAILQLLAEDLRSVVLIKNSEENASFFISSTKPYSLEGSTLFFLAALPREKRSSSDLADLCAIGYFASTEEEQKKTVHHLYRFLIPSKETLLGIAEDRLLELCKFTAFPSNLHCERIASDVTHFEVIPIWKDSEQFSTQPGEGKPSLVEIVLSFGIDEKKNKLWRTIISLH